MNGASLPEIADVLGHKTYQMVKRYAHLSKPHVASVIELHRETERRLLAMQRVRRDLFRSEAQQLAAAYRLQARRIGAGR